MEYQPQIRSAKPDKDADGLEPGNEVRATRTFTGRLNAGRPEPVWGSQLTLLYVPDVTTR